MKKTIDLLNKAMEMGFDRERALEDIDNALDAALGFDNRAALAEEEISDKLYDSILCGFEQEQEQYLEKDAGYAVVFNNYHDDIDAIGFFETLEGAKGMIEEEAARGYTRVAAIYEADLIHDTRGFAKYSLSYDKDAPLKGYEVVIGQGLMDTIAEYMDDDIREELHASMAPCEPVEFLRAYLERDEDFWDLLRDQFKSVYDAL